MRSRNINPIFAGLWIDPLDGSSKSSKDKKDRRDLDNHTLVFRELSFSPTRWRCGHCRVYTMAWGQCTPSISGVHTAVAVVRPPKGWRLVLETILKFCQSSWQLITKQHTESRKTYHCAKCNFILEGNLSEQKVFHFRRAVLLSCSFWD